MVEVREGRPGEVSVPRRVSSGPKLRRDLAEDFAGSEERLARPRIGGGLRVTLPGGDAGTRMRRWLAGLALLAAVVVTGVGGIVLRRWLLEDRRFFVPASASIEVMGNRHMTRAQLLSVFGEDVERNVLTVPLAERRDELERLPWVEHATVMRLLPHTLRVAVSERTPVAFYRQGGRVGLVDANGVLLDMRVGDEAKEPQYSFPVLSGIGAEEPLSTRAARMRTFGQFMTAMRGAGDGIADRLSEVDLTSPEDVKALVPVSGGNDVLVHFGDEAFLERYQRFEQNLPKWRVDYPKLASADMRYPRQVVLEMKPGTAVPMAAPAAQVPAGQPVAGVKHPVVRPKVTARVAGVRPAVPHLQTAYDVAVPPGGGKSHAVQAGPR